MYIPLLLAFLAQSDGTSLETLKHLSVSGSTNSKYELPSCVRNWVGTESSSCTSSRALFTKFNEGMLHVHLYATEAPGKNHLVALPVL